MNRIPCSLSPLRRALSPTATKVRVAVGVAAVSGASWLGRPRLGGFGDSIGIGMPQGDAVVQSLIAANGAVYAAWLAGEFIPLPSLTRFMARHFMTSVPAVQAGRMHTMLTSAYSHQGFIHIAFNMMALNSFGPTVLQGYNGVQPHMRMSYVEFFAFYNIAAIAGSAASFLICRAARLHTPGLGASGAVFGIATYALLCRPDMGVNVMFIPMSGGTALAALTVMNVAFTVAMLRRFGSIAIDGAAHLGGQAAALGYFAYKSQGSAAQTHQRVYSSQRSSDGEHAPVSSWPGSSRSASQGGGWGSHEGGQDAWGSSQHSAAEGHGQFGDSSKGLSAIQTQAALRDLWAPPQPPAHGRSDRV